EGVGRFDRRVSHRDSEMKRLKPSFTLAGSALVYAGVATAALHAGGSQAIRPSAAVSPVAAAVQAPSKPASSNPAPAPERQTLDRYCVTCHNERLKTAR